MADNQTPQAQYELPEGTGNNPQEDYNENWESADHAGGWLTAEIATGEGGVEGEWYTFDNSGLAKKAQSDSLDNCAIVFMLTEDTAHGLDGLFLKAGNWWKLSWGLDPSKIYYLDQSTPGAWTTVQPGSGLIIVLGRVDQDTETFHIAEGGGGGGGGLNDHATLTNLAWSVAGHTMDTTLSMGQNLITQVEQIRLVPKDGSTNSQIVQISTGAYTPNPGFNYVGYYQSIVKTGGATTTANNMTGVYNSLINNDGINAFGYIYGTHNILRHQADGGNGSTVFAGTWTELIVDSGITGTGRVYGTNIRFFPEGEITLQTYGHNVWIAPSSGGILHDTYGFASTLGCATLGTITGDAYGYYSLLTIEGTDRLSGDAFAFYADSNYLVGVTGTTYAYYQAGANFDYFLYGDADTVPSYLAGVFQVDNTIWSEGTTGATPTSGAGTRFMWIPSKAAMRAGIANGTDWDDANIGSGSFCFSSYRSTAKGSKSFVTGHNCGANGTYGISMGFYCYASGSNSVCLGGSSSAVGSGSMAFGQSITAQTSAFAFGHTITTMTNVVAIGRNIASLTTYNGLYFGEHLTGGTGTRYRSTLIGRYLSVGAINNLMIIGEGVDIANPLIGTTADNFYIGMRSNLPSIVLDGSGAGVGVRALVNILAETFVSEQFYVSPSGSGLNSEAYGQGTSATGDNSLSVGYNVASTGIGTVQVGNSISTTGNNIVAMGENITFLTGNSIAIGSDIAFTTSFSNGVALGTGISTGGVSSRTIIIGNGASANGDDIVAIGDNISVTGTSSIGIGADIINAFAESIALGKGATTTQANEMVIGATTYEIDELRFVVSGTALTFDNSIDLTGFLHIDDQTLDTAAHYWAIEVDVLKTTGASTTSHNLWGIRSDVGMNQSGGSLSNILAGDFTAKAVLGTLAGSLVGISASAVHTAGTIEDIISLLASFTCNGAGTVNNDVVALNIQTGQSNVGHTISGDAYAIYISELAFSGTLTGTRWGIYNSGTSPNFLGGDLRMGSGADLDCFTNGGYFKPRRVSQSAIPTPDANELMVWRDSDDNKTYLVYNDTDEGVRSVEMI